MSFSPEKIARYSDERLFNAIIYRDRHGYPMDYAAACKTELLKRGFTEAAIQTQIRRLARTDSFGTPNDRYNRALQRYTVVMKTAGLVALICFFLLFVFGTDLPLQAIYALGFIALGGVLIFFLAISKNTVTKSLAAHAQDVEDTNDAS